MRWMLFLPVLSCLGQAQITNVQVLGTTNVQAMLSYQSPVDDACSVQVSENSNFSPLVHDIDPALYAGADSDARAGNYSDGRNRIFVIGKRSVEQATDQKWYSRALQTDTLHYYRIRCGSDTASGAFRTANLPVGVTYPWPVPQDPQTGAVRWPTIDNTDRAQTIVDPNYGTLLRRISLAGDTPDSDIHRLRKSFANAAGNHWTDPAASLTDDGKSATYSAATQDWLILTNANFGLTPFYTQNDSLGELNVRIQGSGEGASQDDRTIDVCLTLDGSTCRSQVVSAALGSSDSEIVLGDPLREGLFPDDLNNQAFGVMVRPHNTSGARIAIQSVAVEASLNVTPRMPDGGFERVCAPVKSNGGYHCEFPSSLGPLMYWIQPDTGEARWLGKINASGWGGNTAQCKEDFGMWDFSDPNVYYCGAQLNGKTVLLKGTYTGKDQSAGPGDTAAMHWDNLTPDGSTITELLQKFRPDYDPSAYGCALSFVVNQYAVFQCAMGDQNSVGWLAVFDLGNGQPVGSGGTGQIVAAAQSFASPNTRWCGIHTTEYVGDTNWIGWSANSLDGSRPGPGQGPYTVTLQSAIPAQQGQSVIQVSGEPQSPSGQAPLMAAEAGDVFRFSNAADGWDFVRIVRKVSPTQWVVDRKVVKTQAAAHGPGDTMIAFCSATNLDTPVEGPDAYWNFVQDPQARDNTRINWVNETVLTGGHIVERGDYRIMAHYTGYKVVTPGIPKTWNVDATYRALSNPRFANTRAFVGLEDQADGLGNTYQQHPSFENYRAAGTGRANWFVDFIPFIGDSSLTPSIAAVQGFSQVYKANVANLHRDVFPTFAVCGGRQLKDISPGPIGDQDTYSYCVGPGCASGAGSADVFFNCPAPVSASSHCDYFSDGSDSGVCVGNQAPYGQSVTQFFLDSTGQRNRVLTNALMPWNSPRTPLSLATAYALPDGSWVVFPGFGNNARRDLFMVKVPEQPAFDSNPAAGSQPVSTTVNVSPPNDPTRQMVLQYGGTAAVPNSTAPVDCVAGGNCSVSVNVHPLELLFAQPVFRDATGKTIGQGKVEPQLGTAQPGSGLGKPVFSAAGLVNWASYEPKLAPGAIVSLFGATLADCSARASALPLPASLCGASVAVNGQPGLLRASSLGQLDFVLPGSVQPGQDLNTTVTRDGISSDPVVVPGAEVSAVAPAIYFYTMNDQTRRAVIVNPDGSTNGPDNPSLNMRPLHPGESAYSYANGLGATNPAVPDGQAAPANPPALTQSPVQVFVNGFSEPVSFAGLAPNESAVYRVNFTVDPATPVNPDGQNEIWVVIDGTESPHLQISLSR